MNVNRLSRRRDVVSGRGNLVPKGVLALIGLAVALGVVQYAVASPVVPPWRLALPWTSRTATIEVGGLTIEAEVSDTGELRERGLSYRDGLEPGRGMLFVYEEPGTRSFWMRGMRFCLDIIWIEGDQIVGAAESVCPVEGAAEADLARYRSPEPVTCARRCRRGGWPRTDLAPEHRSRFVFRSSRQRRFEGEVERCRVSESSPGVGKRTLKPFLRECDRQVAAGSLQDAAELVSRSPETTGDGVREVDGDEHIVDLVHDREQLLGAFEFIRA